MKTFFDKLGKNRFYVAVFKNPFTYVTGAILLVIFQVVTLVVTGNPWGVSGAFANWGAWIAQAFGADLSHNYYFAVQDTTVLNRGFLDDPASMRNVALILGALAATLLASQFKFKKIKSKKQIIAAVLGGTMMGYGARLAFGCNIGALFSAIGAMSLSGWVFAIFLFVGAYIGSKLLANFFM